MVTAKKAAPRTKQKLAFITDIPAGFPSPAADSVQQGLDLNQLVIEHPSATFFVRVIGYSMKDIGIYSGDILVVDRSLEPHNNDVVVAIIDGSFTVKRIHIANGKVELIAENSDYKKISVSDGMEPQVWGVVTHVIHKCR